MEETSKDIMTREYKVTVTTMPNGKDLQLTINDYPTYFFKSNERKKAERLQRMLLQKRRTEIKVLELDTRIDKLLYPERYRSY